VAISELQRRREVSGLKICVIGGGSTYTPELIEGLIERRDELPVATMTLMDIDENRLRVVGGLAGRMLQAAEANIELSLTTQRKEALEGADYVITQIRVGGLACRIQDEKIPLQFGVVGQETTGPGGFAKAVRTIPVLLDIAHDMAEVAPGAHLINFTNPSGIITEALLKYTTTPTVGLCNSPVGFQRGIAQQLGVAPERIQLNYVGLNHLSWIRGVRLDGEDVFDQVLEGAMALARAGESPFSPECSDPLELGNYDSSSRISPRKGKHYVRASNVHTRVQGPGSTRRVDRHQGQGRDLSGVPAEATGFLPLARGIPGTGTRDLCHKTQQRR